MTRLSIASSPKPQTCSNCGQATVEFALIVPLLLMAAVALLDITWLAIDQCQVNEAARLSARAAIVENSNFVEVAQSHVVDMLGSDATTRVRNDAGLLTVRVSRRHFFLTPLLSQVLPPVVVRSSSTMLIEPQIRTIGE